MLAALTPRTVLAPAVSAVTRTTRQERSRLTLFCVVSIALHAVALAINPPGGTGMGRGFDGARNVLHAVLGPLHTALESPPADAAEEILADAVPVPPTSAPPQTVSQTAAQPASASGITAGSFPIPDRWLAAEELSVRAEPLTHVEIDYPARLANTGMSGRVRLVLHIDERGVVRKAQIEESVPEGVFDGAALAAWAEVPFSPAMKDGVAVKSLKHLEISFLP
jgi:TonB family protein